MVAQCAKIASANERIPAGSVFIAMRPNPVFVTAMACDGKSNRQQEWLVDSAL
jgi:hypothetical protein